MNVILLGNKSNKGWGAYEWEYLQRNAIPFLGGRGVFTKMALYAGREGLKTGGGGGGGRGI